LTARNYTELQQLYSTYVAEGFVILGFPCNQFGRQEPGSNEEILSFVQERFGVTFPMFDKIDVNGSNTHPIFVFLKSTLGGTLGSLVKWNFTKFLVDRNGIPFQRYGPKTNPLEFEDSIKKLLEK